MFEAERKSQFFLSNLSLTKTNKICAFYSIVLVLKSVIVLSFRSTNTYYRRKLKLNSPQVSSRLPLGFRIFSSLLFLPFPLLPNCTKEKHHYGSSQATILHSYVLRNNAVLLSSHPEKQTEQNDLSSAVKKKLTYEDVDFRLAPQKDLNLNISLI